MSDQNNYQFKDGDEVALRSTLGYFGPYRVKSAGDGIVELISGDPNDSIDKFNSNTGELVVKKDCGSWRAVIWFKGKRFIEPWSEETEAKVAKRIKSDKKSSEMVRKIHMIRKAPYYLFKEKDLNAMIEIVKRYEGIEDWVEKHFETL